MMDLADRVSTIKFLLPDRNSRFTRAFDAVFAADDIRILTSPPGAPRANAICERFSGTLRRELLDRVLVVNERTCARFSPFTRTISMAHGHTGRWRNLPGPGRGPAPTSDQLTDHQVRRRLILGGFTSECQVTA